MKKIVYIILACIVLLAFIFIYALLSSKQSQLNDQLTKLELELKVGNEKYTRCYYSINNGSYIVSDVAQSHLRYDSSDAEKAQLNKIESDFMDNIHKKCDAVVKDYEVKYEEYKKKAEKFAESSWVTFVVGGPQAKYEQVDELNEIRFKTGDALTYFVFTKEEVEDYFTKQLMAN